jgi:starch phosphorylase
MSKASMKSAMPHFNSLRMAMDYVTRFYGIAIQQRKRLAERNAAGAIELAQWRTKVAHIWPKVKVRRLDAPIEELKAGAALPIRVAALLDGLKPEDVVVECLVGVNSENGDFITHERYTLQATGKADAGETTFSLDLQPRLPGLQYYKLRMYPYHTLLSHPFETGCMIWL